MDSQLNYALRYILGTQGKCLTDEQALQLIEACEKKLSRSKAHIYFAYPPVFERYEAGTRVFAFSFFRVKYPGFDEATTFGSLLLKRGYNMSTERHSYYCSREESNIYEVDLERGLLVKLEWESGRIEPNKIYLQLSRTVPLPFKEIEAISGQIQKESPSIITLRGDLSNLH